MHVFTSRCASVTVLVLLVPSICLAATWTIMMPDADPPHDQVRPTSNIGATGMGPMNTGAVVACRLVGATASEQEEAFLTDMAGMWAATLDAPQGGWILGKKHEVYIKSEPTTKGYVEVRDF